jgi:uncharacterized membrane protein
MGVAWNLQLLGYPVGSLTWRYWVAIAYGILKFLHVLSVVAWIGGVIALTILTRRIARERNREILAAWLRQATSYGQMVAGPASGIVILTGLAMVGMAKLGFTTLWVVWGYIGIAVHFWLGAVLVRKRTAELAKLAVVGMGDDAALLEAGRRLWVAQLIYVALMATVVAAMVLKPNL